MRRPEPRTHQGRTAKLATVAEVAGVSRGLASRVLNNDPTISVRDSTRERVTQAAKKLNYVPQASARALRSHRTGVLGLAVHDLSSTVVVGLLDGAREEAKARGYMVLVTDADEIAESSSTRDLYLAGGRVDGLAIQDGHADVGGMIEELAAQVPTVVFNAKGRTTAPGVMVDEKVAGQLAAEHLVAMGHTAIAYLGGPSRSFTNMERLSGVVCSLEAAECDVDFKVIHGEWSAQSGADGLRELLRVHSDVTAVVTANALIGTGALSAVPTLGLRVPDDISLVSIQDSWTADFMVPPMTTVGLPLQELGSRAIDILIRFIEGEDIPPDTCIRKAPVLLTRQSVRELIHPHEGK